MASNTYPTEKIRQDLRFIAEQQIVLFSHLQELLGRTKTDNGYEKKKLSVRTTNGHVARLISLGIGERKYINYHVYFTLTRYGYEYIDCTLPRTFPRLAEVEHTNESTRARLWTEANTGIGWIPERSPECMHGAKHRVDYNTHIAGQCIAIQIETSLKNSERLRDIFIDLAGSFKTIWYFAKPNVVTRLVRIRDELPAIKEQFIVIDLEAI